MHKKKGEGINWPGSVQMLEEWRIQGSSTHELHESLSNGAIFSLLGPITPSYPNLKSL